MLMMMMMETTLISLSMATQKIVSEKNIDLMRMNKEKKSLFSIYFFCCLFEFGFADSTSETSRDTCEFASTSELN
jgi:hypothetical protein